MPNVSDATENLLRETISRWQEQLLQLDPRNRLLYLKTSATNVVPIITDDLDAFIERLQAEGIDIRVRVYLCRDRRPAIPLAFKSHSLIVVAGRRGWWPRQSQRLRRMLEAAGHFVVFVDTSGHKETTRA